MNIYEMFILNGGADFWVIRQTWGKSIARVVHVGGLSVPAPYYGNPEVIMDLYNRETGELEHEGIRLSCPGTSQYRLVDIADWKPSAPLRSVTCPAPNPAFKIRMMAAAKKAERIVNKRRQRKIETEAKPRFYFESNPRFRNEKNNIFGEKFYVRWDPDKKLWWCLQEDTTTQATLAEMGCVLIKPE